MNGHAAASDTDTVPRTDFRDPVVFVLGAGFSRAISPVMPLTDELGRQLLMDLRRELPRRLQREDFPPGQNFETWLSQLAVDQPYLTEVENAENRATFLRMADSIDEVLSRCMLEALGKSAPIWLAQFIRAAHHARSTLVTFNYDTLIECLVFSRLGSLGLHGHEDGQVVDWSELTGGLPPRAAGDARVAPSRADTLRLLKLHGSLNWYWRPGDDSGLSVARRSLPGRFGEPEAYEEEERRREVPGRSPFVVPPTASKSAYYSNPITREMWSQTAARLREASTVAFMGYSLPPADTTFTIMLADAIRDSDCSVVIADLSPDGIGARLADLGIAKDRITAVRGQDSVVPTLVNDWITYRSRKILEELVPLDPQLRVILAWGDNLAYAPVASAEPTGDQIRLSANQPYSSFGRAAGLNVDVPIQLADILALQRDGATGGLFVASAATSCQPIVAAHVTRAPVGAQPAWLVLHTAAEVPETRP